MRNSRTTDLPAAAKSAEFLARLRPRLAACALLRSSRKTECGASQCLDSLEVRAATFALLMRARQGIIFLIGFAAPLLSQSSRIPVVLLNGYQATCNGMSDSSGDSSATFGSMQSLLQQDGWTVSFFDNCSVRPGTTGTARPTIEELAQAFGNFLETLQAPEVDVVAHSMGGLIVRAWLAGKQPGGGFSPPPETKIRKAVLIATPNAGLLSIAGLVGANVVDSQNVEMFAGSTFLWDLATWNQRRDDLRGVDALSIAGNLGSASNAQNATDGVVVSTSASLAATFGSARVRVLPYCHANNLPSFLCDGPGIAMINSRNHPTYQIVTSFLSGTNAWQSIGANASQDTVLSRYGGLLLNYADNTGAPVATPGPALVLNAPEQADLPWNTQGVFFADYMPAGQYSVRLEGATYPLPIVAGGHISLEVKQGPQIALVAPAAGIVPTLNAAPGMLVSIYGSNLQDATVTIDGIAAPDLFNSGTQINSIVPAQSQGLVQVSVANALGRDALNLLLAPAVPALFSTDGSGTGAALALHTADSSPVSASSPARPGENVSVFVTGLGIPPQTPSLQAGGAATVVLGISPLAGSPGVVQLNFTVPPSSGATMPLVATVGNYSSNVVTLPVAP